MTMAAFDAVAWNAAHGRPCFAIQIEALRATKSELIGEGGRYWQDCPHITDAMRQIDAEIEELAQAAYDRFDDLRSDPLP